MLHQVFLIYLAKKSGNFGSATQLSKQLVQETLLDEGLRVVKEFSGSAPSKEQMDLNAMPSPPNTSIARKEESHLFHMNQESSRESLMTPPTCVAALRDAFPSMTMPMTRPPIQTLPRPRGRPPKNPQPVDHSHNFPAHPGFRDLRTSLEAAYHAEVAEKLQQHFQQTFLANQYSQQMMAAANGFSGLRRMQESLSETSNGVKGDPISNEDNKNVNESKETKPSFRTSSPKAPPVSQNGLSNKTINRSLEELESCLNSSSEVKSNGLQPNSLESLVE